MKKKIVAIADCETNGYLEYATKLHSLCYDKNGEKISAHHDTLEDALRDLMQADEVWFHNGIEFDVAVLKKLYPWFTLPIRKIRDTLILSRLMCPHLKDLDASTNKLPKKLWGSHSLEAWGHRLGKHKGDYAKEMEAQGLDPWAEWNPFMQDYCDQDVEVTVDLVNAFKEEGIPERASEMEHWFAVIMHHMQQTGFQFDLPKAKKLEQTIHKELEKLEEEIKKIKPWYKKDKEFIPKRTQGLYTKDVPFTKIKLQEFNPNSRQQVGDRLQKIYGWAPFTFTPTGQPKIDEDSLSHVEHPIGKALADRFILQKRLGQLSDGANAWIKLVKPDNRIYGKINPLGARTGRCTHSNPNMAQVPGVNVDKNKNVLYGREGWYAYECRELFTVRPGYVLIGADAAGLELRCLAHYLATYDEGEYARILLNGDIHTVNQKAAGLPTRGHAKTFIYAFLYGAGDAKIGKIVGGSAAEGKQLKNKFLNGLPALKQLKEAILQEKKVKGYITGIDGRKLLPGPDHATINTKLQSAGGLLVKQATVNLFKQCVKKNFTWGKDWAIVAHVHDEYQLEVREEIAQEIADIAVWSFQQAGRDFDWKCPLDGEAKIGHNWAETH